MSILRKMFNKSNWDYVADFKDNYALAVHNNGYGTVYLIDENYEIASSTKLQICLFDEESVKKVIINKCKYLAACVSKNYGEVSYYTFLDTQLKEVEGHKYRKILYYVQGKTAIVVEMNGDVILLNGDLKREKTICNSDPDNRYIVVNQDYFYVTNDKTLKLINIKTREIKEFKGNHITEVADGEFYRVPNKDGDMYYDKNFNLMKDYERIGKKDKTGRIPIILKNGEIFIYHCN